MPIIVENGWPACGTCSKPVDHFGQQTNALNSDVVFVAQCHGAEERVSITQRELSTMTSMTMTTAFVPASDEAVDTSIEDADSAAEDDVIEAEDETAADGDYDDDGNYVGGDHEPF
jgi:hypothetical protein